MATAYVDSSAIVAVGLGERGWEAVAARLDRFDPLSSADLIEAEVRSAFAREGLAFRPRCSRTSNASTPTGVSSPRSRAYSSLAI